MKKTLPIKLLFAFAAISFFAFSSCTGTTMETAFNHARQNTSALQQFFAAMPKGGDLHNHLIGSVFPETYFDIALAKEMWLDTTTYIMYPTNDAGGNRVQLHAGMNGLHKIRMACIDAWSARNFALHQNKIAPDEFFFDSFDLFLSTMNGSDEIDSFTTLVKELRVRAAKENVLYLEIMINCPPVPPEISAGTVTNQQLRAAIAAEDEAAFTRLLETTFALWESDAVMQQAVNTYTAYVTKIHEGAKNTAPEVTTYYQAFTLRQLDPLPALAQSYISFKATQKTPLLVGVNIVQAENGETSLRDYWGHIRMFRFLKEKIPVKTAMHAGELRMGLVPPEDLQFHIHDAVLIAGADRIGHGVDIAFEKDSAKTLQTMAAQKIAIEINLSSNEFILGVRDGEHPFMLYYENGVPITLSTDDAGILRTNLIEQYVLAAERYPKLTYNDFKQFSRNSIQYGFLPDSEKQKLLAELEKRFAVFEANIQNSP